MTLTADTLIPLRAPVDDDARRATLRLCVPDGVVSVGQMSMLSQMARRHGLGFIQLAGRQRVEIPGIPYGDLQAVRTVLLDAGLCVGNAGRRDRSVVVCAGKCPHAFVDMMGLAAAVEDVLEGDSYPGPVRVAISSCCQGCTSPMMSDIGFIGTVDPTLERAECEACSLCAAACTEGALVMRRGLPRRDPQKCTFCGACIAACPTGALRPGRIGYTLYVAGRAGTRPQMGTILGRFLGQEEAPEAVARILSFAAERARPREQVTSALRRVGLDALRAHLATRSVHWIRPQGSIE